MAVWHEIALRVVVDDLETAAAVATVVSPDGIFIEDYSDMLEMLPTIGHYDYISEELSSKDTGVADIHLYLAEDAGMSKVVSFIEDRLNKENIPHSITFRDIDELDWSESWKQFFHPRRIGSSIVIAPSWEEYEPNSGEYVIVLDPGMSFGTGDHESTQLALELLEQLSPYCMDVLDIGTGSGILGIAALMLDAKGVFAIDISSVAIEISRANAKLNGFADRFTALQCDVADDGFINNSTRYDLILSNVVANFHISNADMYYDKLKPGGSIILSGIIEPQLEDVIERISAAGFGVYSTLTRNGWCALRAEICS